MTKIGKFLFLILIGLVFQTTAYGVEVKLSARVEPAQVALGDPFILNIAIEADDDFEYSDPNIPKVAGLEVINMGSAGRQSSTTMSIINGKSQFIQKVFENYMVTMAAQKEGTFVIPSFEIKISGAFYKTNPVKIEVSEQYRGGSNANNNKGNGRRFPPGFGQEDDEPLSGQMKSLQDAEDLFEQMLQEQRRVFGMRGGLPQGRQQGGAIPERQLDVNTKESFFIYLDLDKTTAYEGEQVTANWYIYTRGNIESLDRAKFPDLKGFWKEIIEEVPSLQFTPEIVNGIEYRKALLASHALFPIKAGTAVIDEFKLKAKTRMMTQFGLGSLNEFTKSSKRVPITVMPLPQEGKTVSFSGAVGSYKVNLSVEGTTFPANQPFSVKIRYEGIGNAKLIELPPIEWPSNLEVYDTKSQSKFFKDGTSYKEFEVLLVPKSEGEAVIPSFPFTYFDPNQKKYVTEVTQELRLTITKGDPNAAAVAKENGAAVGEVFKPVLAMQWPNADFISGIMIYKNYIIALVVLLIAAYLLFKFIKDFKAISFKSNFSLQAEQKIANLKKLLEAGEDRKIGAEAINLLYLNASKLAGSNVQDKEMQELLAEMPTLDKQQFGGKINELFDYFQTVGFAPQEIMQNKITNQPISNQVHVLVKLTQEVVAKATQEES